MTSLETARTLAGIALALAILCDFAGSIWPRTRYFMGPFKAVFASVAIVFFILAWMIRGD